MLANNTFYRKMEIDKIIDSLINEAILPNSKLYFDSLIEENDINKIQILLDKADEAYLILNRYERCPIYNTMDLDKILLDASKEKILSGIELYEFIKCFHTIRSNINLKEELKKNNENVKYFYELVDDFIIIPSLEDKLKRSIDDTGYILDDASPTLKKIRSRLRGIDDRIRHRIQEIMGASANMLADSVVVMRDDRYCLAIKSEYKNSFKGILHDVSNTQLTCFMEPLAIAEMSNEKDRLRNDEKMEEEIILRDLTADIENNYDILKVNFERIVELDINFAKAKIAKDYNGSKPNLNTMGHLNLINARHPLLKVKKVIPNNIYFGKDYYGIVITGPNTGGKTVLLKTVGLLSLMVKFGLLIPADKESDVMIYDHILCDIGDDQSIEENLSTFSSHMKKMVKIVNTVTKNSLALFDEIGAGTDPKEGALIATSVLNYFIKKEVRFIVTTHYAELKTYAYGSDKVVNASMAFNQDTYEPTYHLVIGRSGSSNAFTIASNLGLKKEIIDEAKHNYKQDSNEISSLIKNIEKLSFELELEKEKLSEKVKETDELKTKLDKKYQKIDDEKIKILNDAKTKANKIIDSAKDDASKLLAEIEALNEKEIKLHEIIAAKAKISSTENHDLITKKKEKKKITGEIKVGDRVFISEYEQFGNIERINRNKTYTVSIGNMKIDVPLDMLEPAEAEIMKDNNVIIDTSGAKAAPLSLDLRGMTGLEAKDALDKYIDDLIVSNRKSATIIHGYGTGVVREIVQDYLKKCKYIDSFRYGGAGEGGLGVTVITLK